MRQRLDRPDREDRQQGEGHVRGAEVLEHIAGEREGQALSAEFARTGNGVPALLDIGGIGLGKAVGEAHLAVLEPGTLEIAHAVERRELARREPTHTIDYGFDHVGFGGGEAFVPRQLLDPGIDTDREQLVGGGGSERSHAGAFR